ncbi:hypothetical protein [Roseibium alexandrii]|uniref:hypothetical protein n=1 Tax=Roseibium alexandrii TaxID=388408 RepID=UPI0035219472
MSIGMMNDIMVIVVVHTDRDGTQHLISARPANRKERKIYHDAKALRETDYE